MKIAVAVDDKDEIFWHFGHCPLFKMYEVNNQNIVKTAYLPVLEDHGSQKFKAMLDEAVDVVIANGVGPGVMRMFAMTEMDVIAGASGAADEAVQAYLAGDLTHDSSAVKCCGRD